MDGERAVNKFSTAIVGAVGLLVQTHVRAAEKPNPGSDTSVLRIKASGLGTDDWQKGKFVHAQGCTMVKLDRPSPAGYSSLLLVGISHLQADKAGQWTEVAIAPMLKPEPAHCKAGGTD